MSDSDEERPLRNPIGQTTPSPRHNASSNSPLRRSLRQQRRLEATQIRPTPTVKRKATCWNFFYHPGSGPFAAGFTVACYYCKKCVYNCKSSATLTAHCKAKHRNQFESFKNGEPNEIPEPVQQGIQASFAHSMKFGYTEKGAEELLTNFIVEDDQAFQVFLLYLL